MTFSGDAEIADILIWERLPFKSKSFMKGKIENDEK
jgi:hypothetical protein